MKEKIKIVNLTPHPINLLGEEIPPSGIIARCEETTEQVGAIGEIPIIKKSLGACYNVPEPKENTIYVVSLPVATALAGKRDDVFAIGESVRDEKGRVVGAKSLARV